MIFGVAVIVIGLVIVVWFVGTMNGLRAALLKVDEADSGIDVALTKRYDVLTKQLAVVKEYASYESKTLFETIKIRKGMSMNEKKEAVDVMNEVAGQLQITAESYPELQSNSNFAMLQNSISDVEEHLQAARRLYNANVTSYNTKIMMFPTSIVANMMALTKRELFQAENYKRNDVEMKF